jgi:hypothetical protein
VGTVLTHGEAHSVTREPSIPIFLLHPVIAASLTNFIISVLLQPWCPRIGSTKTVGMNQVKAASEQPGEPASLNMVMYMPTACVTDLR